MSFVDTIKSWFRRPTHPVPFDLPTPRLVSATATESIKPSDRPRNKQRLTTNQTNALRELPPRHALEFFDELNGGDLVGLKKAMYSRAWQWFGSGNYHLEIREDHRTVIIYRLA